MKKDKLYLIISILFVAVSIVLTNGFKGTYSAGADDLYWAVDGSSCTSSAGNCTLKISNSVIPGPHYSNQAYFDASGSFDSTQTTRVPWGSYRSSIKNIEIGGENDIISPKSTAHWFEEMNYASTVDLTYLDTSQVTNMSYMFNYFGNKVENLELDLSNFVTSQVTDMHEMFYCAGYNATTFELDLSNWDTSQVTNMSRMFASAGHNATNWDIGDLSNWDTSKVIDMSHLFSYAGYSATTFELDLSEWNTSQVTDMSWMFHYAGHNATIWDIGDLSNWDTSKVIDMSYLFSDAGYSATTFELDLSEWNTSQVTNMSWMFVIAGYNATNWDIGDLSNWDTSKVTDMHSMFYGVGGAEKNINIDFNLKGWNLTNVTDMSGMFSSAFRNAKTLKLDFSNWIFPTNADISELFSGIECETLELIMKNCDASNSRDLSYYFSTLLVYDCKNFNLDVTGWDTSNVTNMSHMFDYTAINAENWNVIGLETWDVSNVTDMSYMFYYSGNNAKKIELDLSGWDTSKVTNSSEMFDSTSLLIKISVGNNWTLNLTEEPWKNIYTNELYINGEIPNKIAATYIRNVIYWAINNDTLTISNNYIEGNYGHGFTFSIPEWIGHSYDVTKVVLGGPDDIIMPLDMSDWFAGLFRVKELDLTYLDTEYVRNMSGAFSTGYCDSYNLNSCSSSLKKIIGLENLDTSNVEDMSFMFAYNYSLEELDLSGWNTSNVINMTGMFLSDAKLKTIKGINDLDVSKVEEFTNMFSYCSSLNSLDLSNWDTRNGICEGDYSGGGGSSALDTSSRPNMSINRKVRNAKSDCIIFENNKSLNEIKVGKNFNIELPNSTWINKDTKEEYSNTDIPVGVAATYIKNGLVYWKIEDEKLILSGKYKNGYYSLDTNEYILNQNNWKDYSDIIEEVIIEDTIKPIYMNEWFERLTKVKKIDLSNVDTSNLQSVYKLVNDMDNLEELNLTNLDLSNINQCKYLNFEENVILSNYDGGGGVVCSSNSNINEKVESSNLEQCEEYYYQCIEYRECSSFKNQCKDYKLEEKECSNVLYMCNEFSYDPICTVYKNNCSSIEYNKNTCETILLNYYYDNERDIGDFPLYDDNCMTIGNTGAVCLENKYYYEEYENYYAEEFLNTYCENFEVNEEVLNESLENCMSDSYNSDTSCEIYNNYANSMVESNCNNLLNSLDEYYSDSKFEIYEKYCSMDKLNKNTCENILNRCWDDSDSACSAYENYCSETGNTGGTCMMSKYYYEEDDDSWEENFFNTYCEDLEINEESLNSTLNYCLNYWDVACYAFNKYDTGVSISNDKCLTLGNSLEEDYSYDRIDIFNNKCSNDYFNKNICENILDECVYEEDDTACEMYTNRCSEIGNTGAMCIRTDYYYEEYGEESDREILETYCEDYTPTIEGCEEIKYRCNEWGGEECVIYDNYCKSLPITCDIFSNNNKLKQISVDENNVDLVKESLSGPDNETGKWYDREGNPYDVSEILNVDKTYYSTKPSIVKYNAEVDDQTKYIGEDLTLYDEVIKDSDTSEIITKFDTVGGNDIDDVTSLKITTYSLKDFTDKSGNTYLPGSKYTKDEDLVLDVNYNSEDHYNEIELPIPVKHGYKFEYWTLDGERIDEYTPKTNETLVSVWTEIKYNFIDGTDNVNYEEESEDKVIFITDGIIENFIGLYVNGKRFELGEDYTLDGNKIILTEKGKAYLDSLEPGEYEVRAEFSDSNSDVYGIIKVSEKEEPQEEPETPVTPKTSDYILFTVIIALTALISSIFVYKKIEY